MIDQTLIILNKLFIIYLSVVCLLFFLFILASTIKFSEYIKAKSSIKDFELEGLYDVLPVSILVPAYNEELTIGDTVDSILSSDYKQYEIIVISDGSQDNTVNALVDKYKMKEVYKPTKKSIPTKDVLKTYKGNYNDINIIVIDKVNGGKGDALNVGINYASYPIFVALDADSIILKNSIKRLVAPFMKNKKTVAVGGNIKISNDLEIKDGVVINKKTSKNFLVIFQTIEYLRSFMTNRMFWDIFNMNLIISGAFGAFSKKVVIDIGGYKNNTIGEDMELVMRIHKYFLEKKEEYYIAYAPDAECYTQVPDTLKGLRTQRKRWQVGLIHSMTLHKTMFLDKKWFFAKLYFILYEMITPVVEIGGILTIILSLIFGVANNAFVIKYGMLIILFGLALSMGTIMLELYVFEITVNTKNIFKLILLSFIEPLGYRQLISLYRISAYIGYSKNKRNWGTIQRKKNKKISASTTIE